MLLYTNSIYKYNSLLKFFFFKNKIQKSNASLFLKNNNKIISFFFFKFLLLDFWKDFLILDFFKNFFSYSFKLQKFNLIFIFFYLNSFFKNFNKIINVIYYLAVNKQNIYFFNFKNHFFNFTPLYSLVLKKKKYFF